MAKKKKKDKQKNTAASDDIAPIRPTVGTIGGGGWSFGDDLYESISSKQKKLDEAAEEQTRRKLNEETRAEKLKKAQAEYEAANKAYSQWFAKSTSDQYLNAISAGTVSKKEQDAFNAQQQPLLDELKRTSDVFRALKDEEDKANGKEFMGLDIFQKGAFEDVVSAKTIAQAVLGTTGEVGLELGRGVGNFVEGLTDAYGYSQANAFDALGFDGVASKLRKAADKGTVNSFLDPADEFLEDYSVLGNSTDFAVSGTGQAAATIATGLFGKAIGLGAKGVSILSKILQGTSAYGHGVSEARNDGATDGEANVHGLLSAGAEVLGEMLFSNMGKAAKSAGVDVGAFDFDDVLAKKLGNLFTSKVWKNAVQAFVKSVGNGIEEGVTGFLQAGSKAITYMKEEDFRDIVKDDNLWEQFFVGALTSEMVQSVDVHKANKADRDLITGLNDDEQTVVDKLVEDEIAKAEKNGKKVKKGDIEAQITDQLEKGRISVEDIEKVLGGDEYSAYSGNKESFMNSDSFKEYNDNLKESRKLADEYEELKKVKREESTLGDEIRVKEIQQRMDELKARSDELKAKLQPEVNKLNQALGKVRTTVAERVKDGKLAESYRELYRSTQKFEADPSKYKSEAAKKTIQNLIDGGIANNTNEFHEFADFMAKIADDKGVVFDITDNNRLKGTRFEVKGAQVNAFIDENGNITINKDSKKRLNSLVGHEVTHVLEGTAFYNELQTAVKNYAQAKGEWDSRLKSITDLYAKYKPDADPVKELTADLIGDYIFTDKDFVMNLSTKNRGLFEKIYDEIKYLAKIATAGSKEARDLERVKKVFEEAWRASGENPTSDPDINYSISDNSGETETTDTSFTPAEIQTIQNIGRNSIQNFKPQDIAATEKLAQQYWKEMGTKSPFYRAWFGDWRASDSSPVQVATKQGDTRVGHINKDTGWAIQNSGKVHSETKALKSFVHREAVPYLPYIDEIIENAVLLDTEGLGKPKSENSLLMHYLYAVADIGNGPEVLKLAVEEMYNPGTKGTNKRAYALQNIEKAFTASGMGQGNSPSHGTNTANAVNTVADLFALVKQMDKDFAPNASSKIVNADGTPKVMYHGSPAQFTIFDRSKAKSGGHYGKGFYFSDSTSHAGTYGNLYSVYLNIRNPLQSGGDAVSRSQVRKYLEAVAENEDYSIENYGTYDVDAVLDIVMGQAKTGDAFQIIQDISATAIGDMVEAAELFNGVNGTKFDGIVAPTETVAFYPEQIKSATDNIGTFDKSNPDINYSLSEDSEATDRAYEDAVFNGDNETAQRMLDDAARSAGYTIKAYHGTRSGEFFVFDKNRIGDNYSGYNAAGGGFDFSTDEDRAFRWGSMASGLDPIRTVPVYLKAEKTFYSYYGEVPKDLESILPDNITEEERKQAMSSGANFHGFCDEHGIDFKQAITSKGYDSYAMYPGAENIAVYEPWQIKSAELSTTDPETGVIIPLSERFNAEKDDIRFSLSESVEETKDLMAIHNLQGAELVKSLELGGLAMPSIAVLKAESGHDKYGDVSLIFPKEAIDPKTNDANKIYGGDAWTPTHPRLEYKVKEKVQDRIRGKYYDLANKIGYDTVRPLYRYVSELESTLNSYGGESAMLESIYDDTRMMQIYLEDSGKGKVDPIVTETRTEMPDTEKKVNQFLIDKWGEDFIRAYTTPEGESVGEHRRAFIAEHKDEIMSAWEGVCREVYHLTEEQVQNVLRDTSNGMYSRIILGADRYLRDGGVTVKTETDYKATDEAIREKASIGYKAWVDKLFKGVEEKTGIRNNLDTFTSSGNRRSWNALHWENTLENVVRAMKAQDQTGADAFAPSSAIFAVAHKKYGSIDDVKADSSRLGMVSEEEYKALEDSYVSRLVQLAESIKDPGERNPYMAADEAAMLIVDAVRNYKTKSGMLRYMQKWNNRVTQATVDEVVSLVNDIANMPTGYFEAKPQRAVGFDEVAVFVIPRNADVKLKQELLNRGYSIAEYDPDVEGDRQKVVNQFEEYKFSLSDAGSNDQGGRGYAVYGDKIGVQDYGYNLEDIAPLNEDAVSDEANSEQVSYSVSEKASEANAIAPDVANPVENVPAESDEALQDDFAPIATQPTSEENLPPATAEAAVEEAISPVRDDNERKWVRTATESEAVNGKIVPEGLDQELIHYEPISNKKTLGNANAMLESMGYEGSVEYLKGQFTNNKVKLNDIALGERLIQEAIKRGDTKTAGDLIVDIAILGTELGQKVQALSIIKRLTPEGQLRMLQRTIQRGKTNKDPAFDNVELTQEMKDEILNTINEDGSYDQAELNKAVENVKQKIADQMDVTWTDVANAWRYLAMLGNPKTHLRNIVSNVAMAGTVAIKNSVARTLEPIAGIAAKVAGKDMTRTKTWMPATMEVENFAKQTTKDMASVIAGDRTDVDSASIKEMRNVFTKKLGFVGGVLDVLSNANSDAMSAEDSWFSRPAFKNALAEYLTANGIQTAEDIQNNPEIVEKAKQYALDQSLEATFRQYSYLANKLNEIEKKNAFYRVGIGAVMPFKKTPINIGKAGLNYSPIGFLKTLTYDANEVRKGNMEASTLIDNLSKNLTGSALTLLGYALAQAGFLHGAGDDDKEGDYDYQLGQQTYSIEIGDKTYSLSWLSPVAMPLFVGANMYEQLVEGKGWNGNVVMETMAQTLDPLSEMSFVSSLNDVLTSYGSGTEKIAGVVTSAGQNYITQFVPTFSSQIAATMDENKRTTAASKDSDFKFLEETVNQIKYKIPGLRQTLQPSLDIWGNEIKQSEDAGIRAVENFIAPWSTKNDITTTVDRHLKSLYRETGENGVLPASPDGYIVYKNDKYNMSANEYTSYKETYGQTAYDTLRDLFNTDTYYNSTPKEQADLVEKVYEYARDVAKKELLADRNVEYTNATKDGVPIYKEAAIKGAIENDMPPDEYTYSQENPEKYKFLTDNGITYKKFKAFDDDTKDAYAWAFDNQGKYHMAEAVYGDFPTYYQRKKEMDDFDAKDEYGNTVNGLKKKRIFNYIESLPLDAGEKMIMFKSYYKSNDDYNRQIIDYLNKRDDISYQEMVDILVELGFKISADGRTITWD